MNVRLYETVLGWHDETLFIGDVQGDFFISENSYESVTK